MKIKNKDLSWLLHISRSQHRSMILLMIQYGISAGITVVMALFAKEIIDYASAGNLSRTIFFCAVLAGSVLLEIVLKVLNQNLLEKTKAKLDITFKNHILSHVIRTQYAEVGRFASGEILNRMFNDVKVITSGMVEILPAISNMIVRFVGSFIVLAMIDYKFTLVFLAIGALVLLSANLFRNKLKQLHKLMQKKEGFIWEFIRESLDNLLIIKSFGLHETVEEKNDTLQWEHYAVRMKRKRINIIANTGLGSLFQLGYLYAIIWGAYGLYYKTLTYGSLAAVIQLIPQIRAPLTNLSGLLPTYYAVLASGERIRELAEQPKDDFSDEVDTELLYHQMTAFRFSDVTFAYDKEDVLENFSCVIKKDELTVITGYSGKGKSTMLKLLLHLYDSYDGKIVADTPQGEVPISCSTRGLFSYVPQGFMLFAGSIRDNFLMVKPDATQKEMDEACRISCADRFIRDLPQGIDTVMGEEGQDFSEGQMQRLAIARAILSDAPILLLDEATSALDEETERAFLQNLKAQKKHSTCILVSHKPAVFDVCDTHIAI